MGKKLFDLTAPQKSIWLTEQFYANTNVNNICGTAIVSELLDFRTLNTAINLVIEKNDIFRLHFVEENNNLKQFFGDYESKQIELIELNSKEEISDLEQKLLSRVFNIKEELFEFKMFKVKNSNICGYMLNIHHIISDAITLGLTCQKIIQEYSALINNQALEINQKATYENYINLEKEYFSSKKYQLDKEYWEEKFKDLPNILTIPSPQKESNNFSIKANRYSYILNKSKMSKILDFCSKSKISVFNLFMGILSIYMYRVNNINDFVIGTPILNRTNFSEKNTLGMFINVAPLRINIKDNSTVLELLSNIATDSMGLLRHQKYSYQSILENIRKTNPSIPNLYNIVLSYQITKANVESNITYETRWAFNGTCANDIDIHLFDLDNTGELNISYDYKIDKYDEQDIIALNNRLNYIIEQILENSDLKIEDLEIATPDERNQILNEFNNTKTDYPSDKTIVELFEEQVELHPDNIAVVFEDEKLTYKELNEKANQLAGYLIENGVKPKSVISICMNRNSYFIISIIATLKIGCCYLPINPIYPHSRIQYILNDSNSKILLTDTTNDLEFLNTIDITLLNLTNYTFEKSKIDLTPKDLAYIIYTSGSTGNPKGVMIKHENLINFIYAFNNQFKNKFKSEDNCLSLTNISFDVSVCEIFTPLLLGATLVLYPENTLNNIPLLCKLLENKKITFTYFPPNLLLDIHNFIMKNEIKIFINKLLVGVEPIKGKTLNNFYTINPNIEIINGYGPTETTICSTFYKFTPKENLYSIVPIGYPLDNNKIIILDDNQHIQPIGVFGELYICGKNVGNGYLNNTELTQKGFFKIQKYSDDIFYKTGDITAWNPDGSINFKGRNDSQIKFRGNRIELGEIDSKIKQIDGITTSITLIKSINTIDCLCSYIVTNTKYKEQDIKSILNNALPQYMIPNHIILLDKLPLTINGKIDKTALPLPSIENDKNIIKPRNSIDQLIVESISNILHITNVSINDNIFDLGMDSLSIINLSTKLYEKLKISITVKDVFQNPIILNLSNFIEKNKNNNFSNIQSIVPSKHYPASRAQKRIFYTANMNPNLCVYNISGGIEFFEKLDFEKIQNSFNILVDRHESFRTYFEIIEGELYQKILSHLNLEISCENISHKNVNTQFKTINTKFNLTKAPLLKVKVLYLDNNHTMLLVSMHHIISDGASMKILLEEFCNIYNNVTLQENTFTYKDFINYEQYFSGSENYNNNKKFWLNEFTDEIPTLNLPTNYTRPSVFSYNGSIIHNKFDKELTNSILNTSKKLQVTPYMFLLATYYILLYKYTGQENIIIGTPTANRDIPEFSNIIGMFVNTLAIRKKIHSSQTTFTKFLEEVKEKCLDCFTHQNYPFDELVKELNLQRDISRNPLFDTMFIYQSNGMEDLKLNGINTKYYIPDTNISKFDLSLEIIPKDEEFLLNLEYCTDLFTREFIENLSNHYIQLVRNILNNLDARISDLEILTITEKNKLLYDFNNTKINYDKNDYIYKLIDKQCLKTPNYTSITFKNQKLSYKELLEKTNSLANYLHQKGIGQNSVVVIMLPRSLELLIAIIATLKTGAAYVPVDPSFPESRVNYMLVNSNASLILTLDNNINLSTPNLCISLSNSDLYNNIKLNFIPPTKFTDPAYIIYTSGSTGNPKGVVIPHKAITNLAICMNDEVDYLKNNYGNMAIASLTTVSFDIFVFETLISLQKGLNVIIATENEQVMPTQLNDLIERNNVKAFQTTPSKMEIIINNKHLIPSLKNIKYVTLVGEALTNKLKDSIRNIGDIIVYNAYGPTETTVFSTYTDVTNYENVTIGKPMYNTQIYILDKDNCLCPIDVPGELCICGDGVGIGYKNIAPNVKNNYTLSPISKRPMYKTGDLAKYLPNGELMYIGRIDNQIKIRGLRIELEEIESKILEYPNINKTVILAQTDSNNRKYLVAYLTVIDKISINKLREHLRNFLPKYMIPSYFEILDEFPYTPNGKVDKKLLPIPNIKKIEQDIIPARDDLDKKILQLFEKLLNLSPIGITDNFFELGGDSLLAINLQIELMRFTEGISYADIFLNPTVKELADKINNINSVVESLSDTVDLLNCNTFIQNYTNIPSSIDKINIGNILLTGATGYLGIHVLNEFIENETGKVYCLLRPEKGISLENKLLNKLHFYFDNKLDNLINKRIFIVNGDITLDNLGLSNENYEKIKNDISTIVNCAAKVSHFGKYELYKKINVDGVQNLIEFCKSNSKKLYHMSTTSISGDEINSNIDEFTSISTNIFKENNFFINQVINNVYVKSKFEAEKLIISEIQNGLDAYILRIGNLMGRFSDGKFQQNIEKNAYVNRLLSFIRIRNIPKYFIKHTLEFTPVDYCANSIIKLLKHAHSSNNRIFHLLDNKRISIKNLLEIFEKSYFKINIIPNSEFKNIINSLLKSNNSSTYLNGLISDFDKNGKLDYEQKIQISSEFSDNYLKIIKFDWPDIDETYINQFFKYLNILYKF